MVRCLAVNGAQLLANECEFHLRTFLLQILRCPAFGVATHWPFVLGEGLQVPEDFAAALAFDSRRHIVYCSWNWRTKEDLVSMYKYREIILPGELMLANSHPQEPYLPFWLLQLSWNPMFRSVIECSPNLHEFLLTCSVHLGVLPCYSEKLESLVKPMWDVCSPASVSEFQSSSVPDKSMLGLWRFHDNLLPSSLPKSVRDSTLLPEMKIFL